MEDVSPGREREREEEGEELQGGSARQQRQGAARADFVWLKKKKIEIKNR
jgi:hypothetical protein